MRVLVTGGAGFIGSHLVESLVGSEYEVTVLDDLSTGDALNLSLVQRDIRFMLGSILDSDLVLKLVEESDLVIHLAAAVGVDLIMRKPLESFTTNTRGTETVANAALRHGKKLLIASTSEIYGKNTSDRLSEDSDRIVGSPSVVRWSYATAKAVDEVLAFQLHREQGLPVVIMRFFNTVGPRQSPSYGMVIPRMIRQALSGIPITVYGDGNQTRCFCHVNDTVRAIRGLLSSEAAVGEVFNIGSYYEIRIRDLAQMIIELTGSTSAIQFVPYEVAFPMGGYEDMRRRVPDISRINKLLGWEPVVSLEETVAQMIASS